MRIVIIIIHQAGHRSIDSDYFVHLQSILYYDRCELPSAANIKPVTHCTLTEPWYSIANTAKANASSNHTNLSILERISEREGRAR